MNEKCTFPPAHPSLARDIFWIASAAVVYFAMVRLGLSLLFHPEGIAAIWPPGGIFLSAILLTRRGLRPPLAAVLCVTDFIAELLSGTPILVSAVYALALTGDAVLSAWLLIRFVGEPIEFRKAREVIGFLALAVILSNGLTSLAAAAASTLISGTSFWNSWVRWAASDGIGNLLVTPFILSWASRANARWGDWTPKRALEGAALFILLALLNVFAFSTLSASNLFSLSLPYVTFPFLLWAALRFGTPGVTLALIILAAITTSFAAAGPAAGLAGPSPDHVLDLQLYLAAMAVPSLFLAAVVTERTQMEEALREREARMNRAEEIARVGSWELDLATDRLAWSDETYRMFGLPPQSFTPTYQAFLDAVHPDDRSAVDAAYSGSLREGRDTYEIEHRIVRKGTGEVRYVREKCEHIRDASGRIVRSIGMVHDITGRKQAEHGLRESEARFRSLFEDAPFALWEEDFSKVKARFDELCRSGVTDLRAWLDRNPGEVANLAAQVRIVQINKTSVRVFGAESKEEITRDLPRYFTADSLEVFKEEVLALAEGRTGFSSEALRLTLGGRPAVFDLTLSVQPGYEQSLSRVLVSFIDTTERKRTEEEREKLQGQLLQAQKMESIGRLAGGVAHDFNNMLGVILGHSEIALIRMEPADPLRTHLEEIQKAAERSADLTCQLLAFARKQTVAPKVLDLNDAVGGMLKMLRRLIGEDLDLAWMPGAELRPIKIDPTQIDQILVNLCVNARDAIIGEGKVTIETANVTFDDAYCADHPGYSSGRYVMLAVSDNGIGMGKEVLDRLFEPFFTTKRQGTGMGLAMVYGIVKQNEGFINVYSEPRCGTTFKIYLPGCPAETIAAPADDQSPAVQTGMETILLVEDEEMLLDLGKTMLEGLGYTVLAAMTSEEAIRLAQGNAAEIDLLITDVVLQGMNGRELSERIRAIKPDMKCLFMSGYTANVIAHRGVLDHGVQFIQKPFSINAFAAKVREALEQG